MMLKIIPYQKRWPIEFREIAVKLRDHLGDSALRIDHIGSTSVPGLAAKDVIDLQISIDRFEPSFIAAMEMFGYRKPEGVWRDHCPPRMTVSKEEWEKWFFRPPAGQRCTHTHVRVQGRANQRFALLFRDYLRGHPAVAEAYTELKRRLAAHLGDPNMYPEVKDPAVDLIYFAAEEWAETTGWVPGKSDA